jgi:hypothetical protein
MQESNNPQALKQFVADCDYYGVDKEWCERARKTLHPESLQQRTSMVKVKLLRYRHKLSEAERIYHNTTQPFHHVMWIGSKLSSRNTLQRKIKKNCPYRQRRALLKRINNELQIEKQFVSEHPCFSDGYANRDLFKVKIQGLQDAAAASLLR